MACTCARLQDLPVGQNEPEPLRDAAPKPRLACRLSVVIATFLHRAANYYHYYEKKPAGGDDEPSNVKKRSKEDRRRAKAEANRVRAAQLPSRQKKKKKKKEEGPGTSTRPPPKPAAPQSQTRATVRLSRFCPRSATFAVFEEAFGRFERSVLAAGERFRVRDVPRPLETDAIGAARLTSESKWRAQCMAQWRRKSVLMWHPDKWSRLAERADEPGLLMELTQAMTRAVLREKRGYGCWS